MEVVGSHDGQPVHRIVIGDPDGIHAVLLSYGATLAEMWVPDRAGHLDDVVLGWATLEDYRTRRGCFGATCGRYANRIAKGRFPLDGTTNELATNEGPTTLHGGPEGFDKRVWEIADQGSEHAHFRLVSADGDQGFPGRLDVAAEYRISGTALEITLTATTDRPTVVNLVNHAYWALSGRESGTVLDHRLRIAAEHYLPVDAEKIPTGAIEPVAGTSFDFRTFKAIGADIAATAGQAFDHNWCLAGTRGALHEALMLVDDRSGRTMRVETTEPGVQVYTAAHLDGSLSGKGGVRYPRAAGVAIEPQNWPDAPNHPAFPSARLNPGETYRHAMRYTFATEPVSEI